MMAGKTPSVLVCFDFRLVIKQALLVDGGCLANRQGVERSVDCINNYYNN